MKNADLFFLVVEILLFVESVCFIAFKAGPGWLWGIILGLSIALIPHYWREWRRKK